MVLTRACLPIIFAEPAMKAISAFYAVVALAAAATAQVTERELPTDLYIIHPARSCARDSLLK